MKFSFSEFVDNAILSVSPALAAKRALNKTRAMELKNALRRYEGAAGGRRHAGWSSKSVSLNKMIGKDLVNLRDRSRDIARNNGYASRVHSMIANNVVGNGILPTPVLNPVVAKGKLKVFKNETSLLTAYKAIFDMWANSLSCDFDGKFNLYGLQHLMVKTFSMSGEVLIVKRVVTTASNFLGIQLQVLEGDFIDTTKDGDKKGGGRIVNGVEYSKEGKPVFYYIFKTHPLDGNAVSEPVPVSDIIHLYDLDRPGQNRGVPLAAPTLLKQRDLDDYEDAELVSKRIQACYSAFISKGNPDSPGDITDPIESMEPGAIRYLNQGEEITFATPPQANGYVDFVKSNLRAISAGYHVTYEMYTNDYSNVNFSSGRMGWLEFSRQVKYWQNTLFIPRVCNVIFEWFAARYSILFNPGKDITFSAKWTPPRREMIDPAKETTANKDAVRAGMTSWQQIVREYGQNPEDVLSEIKEDRQRFADAGLVSEWYPGFDPGLTPIKNENKKE